MYSVQQLLYSIIKKPFLFILSWEKNDFCCSYNHSTLKSPSNTFKYLIMFEKEICHDIFWQTKKVWAWHLDISSKQRGRAILRLTLEPWILYSSDTRVMSLLHHRGATLVHLSQKLSLVIGLSLLVSVVCLAGGRLRLYFIFDRSLSNTSPDRSADTRSSNSPSSSRFSLALRAFLSLSRCSLSCLEILINQCYMFFVKYVPK